MPLPSVLDEIDRLFNELVHRRWRAAPRQLVPSEIEETENGWVISLPVEGLRAQDLSVETRGAEVTVTGYRRRDREHHHGPGGWMRAEHETALHRTIVLPDAADPDSVEAKLQGSTLSLYVRRRRR